MTAKEKIIHLQERLESMRRESVSDWERPIVEVALRAVEDQIVELSRKVRNTSYFLGSPPGDDLSAA